MARTPPKPGPLQSLIGIGLLVLLAAVATAVVAQGLRGRLHPSVERSMTAAAPGQTDRPDSPPSPLLAWMPEALDRKSVV